GGVVGVLGGHGQEREDARQVRQVSVAGGDEVWQELLGAVHHAPVVHVHDAGDVLVPGGLDAAGEGDAGVVDDEVHHAEVLGDGGGVLGHGALFGDVQSLRVHVDRALGADEGDGVRQAVDVDVAECEPGAASGGPAGELPADPGTGAGDDDDFAVHP